MLNSISRLLTLIEFEEKSTIASMRSQDYNHTKVYGILINDFNFMYEFTKELLRICLESIQRLLYLKKFNVSIYRVFEKELWMLKSKSSQTIYLGIISA